MHRRVWKEPYSLVPFYHLMIMLMIMILAIFGFSDFAIPHEVITRGMTIAVHEVGNVDFPSWIVM